MCAREHRKCPKHFYFPPLGVGARSEPNWASWPSLRPKPISRITAIHNTGSRCLRSLPKTALRPYCRCTRAWPSTRRVTPTPSTSATSAPPAPPQSTRCVRLGPQFGWDLLKRGFLSFIFRFVNGFSLTRFARLTSKRGLLYCLRQVFDSLPLAPPGSALTRPIRKSRKSSDNYLEAVS